MEPVFDRPESLSTERKQIKTAKRLALFYLGEPAESARFPDIQGCFSNTLIVTMASGQECVIQFRSQRINMEHFNRARRLLGDAVPKIAKLADDSLKKDGIKPYCMSVIPGKTMYEAGHLQNVKTLRSLGQLFSRCRVPGDSAGVVDQVVIPKLKVLRHSAQAHIKPFRDVIENLLTDAAQLKRLPLFYSHPDLNRTNILVHENGRVSGIVDWDGACALPFGMGFCKIYDLAGEIIDGKFYMPSNFEDAERGFWSELFHGLPAEIRQTLQSELEAVQTSVTIGTILLGRSPAVLKVLLTYCIPPLRGGKPPYAK